jgi:hypothetical protein
MTNGTVYAQRRHQAKRKLNAQKRGTGFSLPTIEAYCEKCVDKNRFTCLKSIAKREEQNLKAQFYE